MHAKLTRTELFAFLNVTTNPFGPIVGILMDTSLPLIQRFQSGPAPVKIFVLRVVCRPVDELNELLVLGVDESFADAVADERAEGFPV